MPHPDTDTESEAYQTAVVENGNAGCALMIFALCSGIALIILACRIIFPS